MRNYVIINGVNSLTIPGLAIKSLPPITKPIQRTLREEIDGRDGDIITELGYGAYDKEIEIGLFGSFDVDQIIAYFNQKGTITFSNEPDKVYYFQALNQVDYEELIKFREAGVELHCQPFKYPLTEEPLIEEYEYVTGSGEAITLDNTEETTFNEIELQGNTEQFQTTGKNKWNILETIPSTNVTTSDNETYQMSTSSSSTKNYTINGEPNTAYTIDLTIKGGENGADIWFNFIYSDSTTETISGLTTSSSTETKQITKTSNSSKTLEGIGITTYNVGAKQDYTITAPMVVKGTTAGDYEPYTGGNPAPNPDYLEDIHVVSGNNEIIISGEDPEDTDTYPINLPEGMEMVELPAPDWHDYFIRGNDEKWYKHKMIGKYTLDGTTNTFISKHWAIKSDTKGFYSIVINEKYKNYASGNTDYGLSNYFKLVTGSAQQAFDNNKSGLWFEGQTDYIYCILEVTTLADANNWLTTHNTDIYYPLAEPEDIEITGDLADQLEALWQATSKRGQTNITQTNNDMPFFMIVSALKLGSDVITIPDGGNIYSKPTIKLEGTGIVDIYLNDVQEFEVDLTEDNEITIDTEKMEAYTETGLANRKVTGDYSKFKLQPGDNELRFSGDLTKATITRYTRWL